MSMFAMYLLIDTVLYSIPRLLVVTIFRHLRVILCVDPMVAQREFASTQGNLDMSRTTGLLPAPDLSVEQCLRVAWVLQMVVLAGMAGMVFLQVVLSSQLRRYAMYARKSEETSIANDELGGLEGCGGGEKCLSNVN